VIRGVPSALHVAAELPPYAAGSNHGLWGASLIALPNLPTQAARSRWRTSGA
jgi:hypothetical protein